MGSSLPASGGYPLSRARLQGYLEGLATVGLSFPGDVVVYECAVNSPEHGGRAAQALFALRPELTAVLAMSDQLALGVISAAREAGRQVPQDISVVGFDDAPGAERVGLTTVRQPSEEKGFQAGRALITRLRGGDGALLAAPSDAVPGEGDGGALSGAEPQCCPAAAWEERACEGGLMNPV